MRPATVRALLAGGGVGGAALVLAARPSAACEAAPPSPVPSTSALAREHLPALVHEALGTGLIVLLGCGGVASVKYLGSGMSLGGASVMWGTAVTLAVYATRDVSGAHLNPAVTTALAVLKPDAFSPALAPLYIGAQVAGAAGAAGLNYALFRRAIAAFEAKEGLKRGAAGSASSFAGAFGLVPNAAAVRVPGALGAEVLATGALSYLIFALGDPASTTPPGAVPALVGASVAALVSVFGPVSGACMNPARDLGPRLVTALAGWRGAALSHAWLYTAGPIAGAVAGGALQQYVSRLRAASGSGAEPLA